MDEVHLKKSQVNCPQCGATLSRFEMKNILPYVSPRQDQLRVHFDSEHGGLFRATARIKICNRCGRSQACTCRVNNEKMDRRKMERRIRDELGLNRPTRRYCISWLKFVQNDAKQRVFSKVFIFSMEFTGEPESIPGTTRITVDVDITIIILNADAVRLLFRILPLFSEWRYY